MAAVLSSVVIQPNNAFYLPTHTIYIFYNQSAAIATCCHLNAAVRAGRVPFEEDFMGLISNIIQVEILKKSMNCRIKRI
jgi:hypothetical protein